MNFSKFTLANLNFFGVGTELTPGNIRVSAMYGRLAKAEPLDLSLNTPNIPIYERMGWGAKLGYGTEQHSIDFIVFGAEDDPNSISNLGDAPKQPNPEENLTLGINLQTLIFERFRFRAESGLSALTLNARDAQSESTSFPSFLFTEKMSTQTNLAIDTRLDYEGEKFLAGVQFKRVDPNYRSLGAYFFNNDMIEYLGNLEFDLLNQKMNVGLSGGIQANNLDLSKPSTTQRFVYSASLSYALDAFSANANYSNNTTDIGYVLNQELDSLNAVVITQNAGVDLSYTIADENKNQHVITLGGNIQEVGDDIANPIESAKSKMMVAHLAYNFMLSESKWRFTTRANYNQNEIAQMLITRYGFGGGISKSLLEDKMNLGLDVNYFINSSDVNTNSTNLTSQFRFGYKIGKGLSVNLNLGVLRTDSEQQTDPFSEMTGKLGIQYNFTVKPKKKKKKTADKKENEDASKENSEEK